MEGLSREDLERLVRLRPRLADIILWARSEDVPAWMIKLVIGAVKRAADGVDVSKLVEELRDIDEEKYRVLSRPDAIEWLRSLIDEAKNW